ncbi:MAG TPA: hypothetical protein VE396_12945 [Xanthobacteraceae bacterium]|nr:hypothetical protein [Xanthobacteraceae bacterium]
MKKLLVYVMGTTLLALMISEAVADNRCNPQNPNCKYGASGRGRPNRTTGGQGQK